MKKYYFVSYLFNSKKGRGWGFGNCQITIHKGSRFISKQVEDFIAKEWDIDSPLILYYKRKLFHD